MTEPCGVVLTLPSGRKIVAVRPPPIVLACLGLPVMVAKRAAARAPGVEMTETEVKTTMHAMASSLKLVWVYPQLSANPSGPDQLHPREVPLSDAVWLVKWALQRPQQQSTSTGAQPRTKSAPHRMQRGKAPRRRRG